MSYNKNPSARVRVTEDGIAPPEKLAFLWPSIARLCGCGFKDAKKAPSGD